MALFATTFFTMTAFAKSAPVETEKVPLDRLLRDLESKSKSAPRDAVLLYALGRLHAVIYAQSPTHIVVNKADGMPFDGNNTSIQPALTHVDQSKLHLQQAFYYYNHAGMAGYNRLVADLGMAWCGEHNLTDPRGAILAYRKLFAKAWSNENSEKGRLTQNRVAVETAGYLLKLLDPSRDSVEITDLNKKVAALGKKLGRRER